jgi:hypothetical protein
MCIIKRSNNKEETMKKTEKRLHQTGLQLNSQHHPEYKAFICLQLVLRVDRDQGEPSCREGRLNFAILINTCPHKIVPKMFLDTFSEITAKTDSKRILNCEPKTNECCG